MSKTVLSLTGGQLTAAVVGMIFLLVVIIVAWPLLLIWALNTLFGLGIAYTFGTWGAAFVLYWFVKGQAIIKGVKENR